MLMPTASVVTTRPHGLHSNVCIGAESAWSTVRASCIVSPQHGQAAYSLYSRIRLSPITRSRGSSRDRASPLRYCKHNLAD
jgi:hypothetical protein